jgi:hypothetical protein
MVISSNSLADDLSISIATGRQFRAKKEEGRGVGKTYGVASAPMFPAPVNISDSAQWILWRKPLTSTAVADICAVPGAHLCSIEVFNSRR